MIPSHDLAWKEGSTLKKHQGMQLLHNTGHHSTTMAIARNQVKMQEIMKVLRLVGRAMNEC